MWLTGIYSTRQRYNREDKTNQIKNGLVVKCIRTNGIKIIVENNRSSVKGVEQEEVPLELTGIVKKRGIFKILVER